MDCHHCPRMSGLKVLVKPDGISDGRVGGVGVTVGLLTRYLVYYDMLIVEMSYLNMHCQFFIIVRSESA